jgi:molybdate transport system substrate-binding protein
MKRELSINWEGKVPSDPKCTPRAAQTASRLGFAAAVIACFLALTALASASQETLIIAASPSVRVPLEAIARAYEQSHPNVRIRISYDTGLGLRQTIAGMQNTGRYFIESGPIHLIAPASIEVIRRLEQRYYVLPGTARAYASVPLMLVVPEAQADAPTSFDALAADSGKRLAVADPAISELGLRTQAFLDRAKLSSLFHGRLDVAQDALGVVDHVVNGEADAGIILASDLARASGRVRPAAVSASDLHQPIVYHIAMERFCPSRRLCQSFLEFSQSREAADVLRPLGFGSPAHPTRSGSK